MLLHRVVFEAASDSPPVCQLSAARRQYRWTGSNHSTMVTTSCPQTSGDASRRFLDDKSGGLGGHTICDGPVLDGRAQRGRR
jgi:hypothetical protein